MQVSNLLFWQRHEVIPRFPSSVVWSQALMLLRDRIRCGVTGRAGPHCSSQLEHRWQAGGQPISLQRWHTLIKNTKYQKLAGKLLTKLHCQLKNLAHQQSPTVNVWLCSCSLNLVLLVSVVWLHPSCTLSFSLFASLTLLFNIFSCHLPLSFCLNFLLSLFFSSYHLPLFFMTSTLPYLLSLTLPLFLSIFS